MPPDRILLCIAAPAEVRAVLAGLPADGSVGAAEWTLAPIFPPSPGRVGMDLVISGVGKSNAAGATARVLDPLRHRALVNLGICGSLPHLRPTLLLGHPPVELDAGAERALRPSPGSDHPHIPSNPDLRRRASKSPASIAHPELSGPPALCAIVLATASVFADEGVTTDAGFSDIADLGFPPAPGLGPALPADPELLVSLRPLADAAAPIATVSTCSGTDAHAAEVARRTGAVGEAMEGAAVALVAHRLGVPFAELRVVSNTTGSRTRQRWDLPGALARLSDLARVLPDALAVPPATTGEG